MQFIEKAANKKGTIFALAQEGESFWVWKLSCNYSAHVRGGVSKTWRYVARDLTEQAARTLYSRRLAGVQL